MSQSDSRSGKPSARPSQVLLADRFLVTQAWNFADYGRHEAPLDVYSGVAGVLGVLAQAAATGDYPGVAPVLASAADWLKDRHQHGGTARPGPSSRMPGCCRPRMRSGWRPPMSRRYGPGSRCWAAVSRPGKRRNRP